MNADILLFSDWVAKVLFFPIVLSLSLTAKLSFWAVFLSQRQSTGIPGPWFARWSRLWLLRVLLSGNSAKILAEVNKTYGNLARIGPNQVVTDDTETIRRILSRDSPYVRAAWFDSLKMDPQSTNIVSERNPEIHAALRYNLGQGYMGRKLPSMENNIDDLILKWIDFLRARQSCVSEPGRTVDLGVSIEYLTVDSISKLCLGESFGCMENDSDQYDFLQSVRSGMSASLMLSVLPEVIQWLYHLTKWSVLHRLLVPKPTDNAGIGKSLGAIQAALDARNSSEKKDFEDMMSVFLSKNLGEDQVREELLIAMVAGSETTSTAIQGVALSILCDARVHHKLMHEINTAVDSGVVSFPITNAEAKRLPYLQACIKEGMRRFPPVGQLRERMVPPQGDVVLGHHLSAGTCIGFNPIGLQMSPVFGIDPGLFRPERWLITDQTKLDEMHRTHDLLFGHGPTRCLGSSIAMMEINKAIFELCRSFNISIADPMTPCKSVCWGVFFQEDLNVCVYAR